MLDWRRGGKYHQTCGSHNVAAVRLPQGLRYEAWRTRRRTNPPVHLGIYTQAADARARCEEDAR